MSPFDWLDVALLGPAIALVLLGTWWFIVMLWKSEQR
jgi:hypothetical protein